MATRPNLELPDPVLAILPSDPFEQLDIARKITSLALSTRVSALESEASQLRQILAQKEDEVAQLTAQVQALDASLVDLSSALARADEEKATLVNENVSLSNTVKKLNRDVSKLEVFKKALMQSLNEEEDNPQTGVSKIISRKIAGVTSSPPDSIHEEDDSLPPRAKLSVENEQPETGSSVPEDGGHNDIDSSKEATFQSLRLPSLNSTPRLTPPGSPPRSTAGLSPPKVSRHFDPRRHSISVSSMRNMPTDRQAIFSSVPSSQHNVMTSPFEAGSQTGRTRVDGKEFFRQVRSRLSYEQFTSFLANVKELNSHKQTREETLRKAEEIFGPDNKDLFAIFEGLITRNLH